MTFYIKNTGTGDLSTDDLLISVNGTVATGSDLWTVLLDAGNTWSPGKTIQVNMLATGLQEDVDYHGWGSTSGITSSGGRRGTTQETFVFRIWEG